MSINIKKYTKDQMAKMVEDAQEKSTALEAEIAELKNCIDEKNDLIAEYANLKAAMQRKNVTLTERIDQMNGESVNKANEIANLKADADALRNKLADTEAALGRANAELGAAEGALGEMIELRAKLADAEETLGRTRSVVAYMQGKIVCANDEIVRLKENLGRSESRANWAASHPWSNLWAWIKRKLFW